MQQFPDDPMIQCYGCMSLVALSLYTHGNPTSVVIDGGRQVLEKEKTKNASDKRVTIWARTMLKLPHVPHDSRALDAIRSMQQSTVLQQRLPKQGI